jgi:hypothetical protein
MARLATAIRATTPNSIHRPHRTHRAIGATLAKGVPDDTIGRRQGFGRRGGPVMPAASKLEAG